MSLESLATVIPAKAGIFMVPTLAGATAGILSERNDNVGRFFCQR